MYEAPYTFNEHSHLRGKNIHLGVCGSIAAFRAADLLRWWKKSSVHVSVTLTEAAQRFITPLTFEALGASHVHTDMWQKEAIFAHLEPGQNAHAMVIAPASANTLAQMAHGQADSLLTCQALAFDGPIIVAPSMNPRMWNNAATKANVDILQKRGVQIIVPEQGSTACGDEGQGRLADVRHIWLASLKALTPQDMQGQEVMLTLGPTREPWDAVRFWSNPSTGTMGLSLALVAWLRGATVHAICGPEAHKASYMPPDVHIYKVQTAQNMYEAAADLWPRMDAGLFTAAVADYAPAISAKGLQSKFKKETAQQGLHIDFTPNVDILRTLAAQKKEGQKILGFAAETAESTEAMLETVRQKLARKGADILAGNTITAPGSGFGTSTNAMFVVDRFGKEEVWPLLSKLDVAWRLCSWLQHI